VSRVWDGALGPAQRLVGLLGLFLTSLCLSAATGDGRHRRLPRHRSSSPLWLAGSPKEGVLLIFSDDRWGSCPTLPHGELRLCRWGSNCHCKLVHERPPIILGQTPNYLVSLTQILHMPWGTSSYVHQHLQMKLAAPSTFQ